MRLSHLLKNIIDTPPLLDRDIAHLQLDSRKIGLQDMFVALSGTRFEGKHFIAEAIARGASAILIDAPLNESSIAVEQNIPIISVPHLQRQVGDIAARFYAYPSKKLCVMGVTGTSGKTSCTHFIAQLLQQLNVPCGLIGTLGSGFYGALGEAGLTTPDALSLQAMLHDFAEQKAKAVAMEVSSHSIHQERVRGIDFEMAIFTNLSQDHLDYHGDMATYAAVKRRLFAELPVKHLIINADDVYGQQWIAELSLQKPIYAFSMQKQKQRERMVFADKIELSLQGMKAKIYTPWGDGNLLLPLIGEFNLSNSLAVLAALCLYGLPFHDVLAALATLQPVVGRMQLLGGGKQPLVVVDYAHKPDALLKVLQTLRAHTQGKLYCVFGCGGERDHLKRPLMAKIAEEWADRVIITNDNPRSEEPATIVNDILRGFVHPERVSVIFDRSKAIENSIQWAGARDCVLIAGKGAERYQQIGDEKIPFDDVSHVEKYLYT